MDSSKLKDPSVLASYLRRRGIPARKEYGRPFVRLLECDDTTGETSHSDFIFWLADYRKHRWYLEHDPKDPKDMTKDPFCATSAAPMNRDPVRALATGLFLLDDPERAGSVPAGLRANVEEQLKPEREQTEDAQKEPRIKLTTITAYALQYFGAVHNGVAENVGSEADPTFVAYPEDERYGVMGDGEEFWVVEAEYDLRHGPKREAEHLESLFEDAAHLNAKE